MLVYQRVTVENDTQTDDLMLSNWFWLRTRIYARHPDSIRSTCCFVETVMENYVPSWNVFCLRTTFASIHLCRHQVNCKVFGWYGQVIRQSKVLFLVTQYPYPMCWFAHIDILLVMFRGFCFPPGFDYVWLNFGEYTNITRPYNIKLR